MTDEIPERLRRGADNIAPFMLHPDVTSPMPVQWPDPRLNPSDSPQETSQDWVPPWASKS